MERPSVLLSSAAAVGNSSLRKKKASKLTRRKRTAARVYYARGDNNSSMPLFNFNKGKPGGVGRKLSAGKKSSSMGSIYKDYSGTAASGSAPVDGDRPDWSDAASQDAKRGKH